MSTERNSFLPIWYVVWKVRCFGGSFRISKACQALQNSFRCYQNKGSKRVKDHIIISITQGKGENHGFTANNLFKLNTFLEPFAGWPTWITAIIGHSKCHLILKSISNPCEIANLTICQVLEEALVVSVSSQKNLYMLHFPPNFHNYTKLVSWDYWKKNEHIPPKPWVTIFFPLFPLKTTPVA